MAGGVAASNATEHYKAIKRQMTRLELSGDTKVNTQASEIILLLCVGKATAA
jgi:hypothetical protein